MDFGPLIRQLQGALAPYSVNALYSQAIGAGTNWTSSATFTKIARIVILQGSFSKTGGTPAAGDVMGTLSTGARPAVRMNVAVATQNNDVAGTILINTDGTIVWRSGSTAETDSTSIDGIVFIVP